MYEPRYSRNTPHPNEESRREEARNWCCLVNRQFLGGYEMLVPIYCPPPTPGSEICLGGRRRRRKGRAQPLLAVRKVPVPQHPANTQGKENRIFFHQNHCALVFPLSRKGRNTTPPRFCYSCLPERVKERGEGRGGAWPAASPPQRCPACRSQQLSRNIQRALHRLCMTPPQETCPPCQGESTF